MFRYKYILLLLVCSLFLPSCELPTYYFNYEITNDYDMTSFQYLDDKFTENTIEFEFIDFEGYYTLCEFQGNISSSFCLYYSINISSGNFKLVVIDSKDNIIETITVSELSADSITFNLKDSNPYRLKIIGSSTTGSFNLSLSTNNVDITMNK